MIDRSAGLPYNLRQPDADLDRRRCVQRAERLEATLRDLLTTGHEIVVVGDGSSDAQRRHAFSRLDAPASDQLRAGRGDPDGHRVRARSRRADHRDVRRGRTALAHDGRNVIPFVSGDQSPHSTFGFRPAWICFALVALRAPA
jgi:hypothetical protein